MSLPPKRMVREALPVAAILLFWNLLAGVAGLQNVGGSVRTAGVVMAALYVVVRGVSLSAEVPPPATGDVEAVLYENASVAVPAGAWFVAAMAVAAVEAYVSEFVGAISALGNALAGAGLGVVCLYAVAVGVSVVGGASAEAAAGAGDSPESAADD